MMPMFNIKTKIAKVKYQLNSNSDNDNENVNFLVSIGLRNTHNRSIIIPKIVSVISILSPL